MKKNAEAVLLWSAPQVRKYGIFVNIYTSTADCGNGRKISGSLSRVILPAVLFLLHVLPLECTPQLVTCHSPFFCKPQRNVIRPIA